MHCDLRAVAQVVEAQVSPDDTIQVRDQGEGKYQIVVSSPGSKIAAVKIGGISELQLRQLASQIILQV